MAITFTNLALEEPSTVTARVAAVTIARGSTDEQQEILCLGDGQSSLGIAVVTDTTPASTAFGLVVREAVAQSTGPFAISSISGPVIIRSSAADALVSVYQSSAADLNVTVAGYVAPSTTITVRQSTYTDLHGLMRIGDRDASTQVATVTNTDPASTAYALAVRQVGVNPGSTTVNVSSLAGAVIVRSSAAALLASVYQSTAADLNVTVAGYVAPSTTITVRQSTAADLNVTVAGYSTTVNISSLAGPVIVRSSAAEALVTVYQSTAGNLLATVNSRDGAGNALDSSTSAPSTGARGLLVRPIIGGIQTYAASTTGNSPATTIVSSQAASRAHVFAYSITTTLAGPVLCGVSSGATLKWPIVLAAICSAISGVNLAVSPPGSLFGGDTGGPLTFNCETSNAGMRVGIAYWVST